MRYPKLRRYVRKLERLVPCAFPVVVRVTKSIGVGTCGDCSRLRGRKPHFLIRIMPCLNESEMVGTLIHEWAHARCWNHLHDKLGLDSTDEEWHGEEWGVEFSRVYRAAFREE